MHKKFLVLAFILIFTFSFFGSSLKVNSEGGGSGGTTWSPDQTISISINQGGSTSFGVDGPNITEFQYAFNVHGCTSTYHGPTSNPANKNCSYAFNAPVSLPSFGSGFTVTPMTNWNPVFNISSTSSVTPGLYTATVTAYAYVWGTGSNPILAGTGTITVKLTVNANSLGSDPNRVCALNSQPSSVTLAPLKPDGTFFTAYDSTFDATAPSSLVSNRSIYIETTGGANPQMKVRFDIKPGAVGSGNLVISHPGYNSVTVPLQVKSAGSICGFDLTSIPATNVTNNTAEIGGNITIDPGYSSTSTERGVCWGLSANPTFPSLTNCASIPISNSAKFSKIVDNLIPNKTYHYRAYANNGTVGYAPDATFTTLAPDPITIPDLTASEVSPILATVNTPVNLKATIKNQGTATTGFSFNNLFQYAETCEDIGDPTLCTVVSNKTFSSPKVMASGGVQNIGTPLMVALPVGRNNTSTFSYTFSTPGTHYVRACADLPPQPNGVIVEGTKENNNCGPWTMVNVVTRGSPNLTASAVTANPNPVLIKKSVTFKSTITNQGSLSTPSIQKGFNNFFQITTQNPEIESITITENLPSVLISKLDIGESQEITQNYTFSSLGDYYVRACADLPPYSLGKIDEGTNENDNCSFPWKKVTVKDQITSTMTGTLTANPSFCNISAGDNNCNVNISWSTINPESSPSVITSNSPSMGTEIATGNLGNKIVSIPYGSRTFYLSNNNVLLNGSGLVVTSHCISGTSWDGSTCVNNPIGSINMTFESSSYSVFPNSSVTLSWSSTDATSCIASGDWSGPKSTSGIEKKDKLISEKNYTLQCSGPSGSISKSVNIKIRKPTYKEN